MTTVSRDILPTQFWGLDTVFRAHAKLYIKDVLSLEEIESHKGIFQFMCHPIVRVDIQGIVVRVEEKSRFFIYSLDDGTGVVSCTHWKPDDYQSEQELNTGSLAADLSSKWKDIHQDKERSHRGHHLGDLVHIRGKLKKFRDYVEVMASYCVCMNNPNKETERMLLLPMIYTRCYNQPVTLPKVIKSSESQPGQLEQICQSYELETALLGHLQSHHLATFSKQDILRTDCVMAVIDQLEMRDLTLTNAILDMEKGGHIFKKSIDGSGDIYSVTSECTELKEAIVGIIKSWIQLKGDQEGCAEGYIYDKLRKISWFNRLERITLNQCLERLEGDSDIISTAEKRYIVFNDT